MIRCKALQGEGFTGAPALEGVQNPTAKPCYQVTPVAIVIHALHVDKQQVAQTVSSTCGAVLVGQYVWCSTCGAVRVGQYVWGRMCGAVHVVQCVWCSTCGAVCVVQYVWCSTSWAVHVGQYVWGSTCGAAHVGQYMQLQDSACGALHALQDIQASTSTFQKHACYCLLLSVQLPPYGHTNIFSAPSTMTLTSFQCVCTQHANCLHMRKTFPCFEQELNPVPQP